MCRIIFLVMLLLAAAANSFGQNTDLAKKLAGNSLSESKPEEAMRDLDKAIQVDSGFAPAYLLRGQRYADKNQMDSAVADYTQALALTYYQRGLALGEKARTAGAGPEKTELLDKAINDLKSATQIVAPMSGTLKPAWVAEAFYNLASYYAQKGSCKDAITAAVSATSANSNYTEAYLILGKSYQQCAQAPKAEESFRRALQLNQTLTNPALKQTLTELLAGVLVEEGRFDDAVTYLKQIYDSKQGGPDILSDYGYALLKTHKLPEARKVLEEAQKANSADPKVWERLGELYFEMGDYGKAIEFYDQALNRGEDDDALSALINEKLGDAYVAQHEFKAAVSVYTKAQRMTKEPAQKERVNSKLSNLKDERPRTTPPQ
jgi:tetratricopeptide (TPR) repeat protein